MSGAPGVRPQQHAGRGSAGFHVTGDRPILHEAGDEGKIAGYNAAHGETARFRRKTPLFINFCDPNICAVGLRWNQLNPETAAVGQIRFAPVGRALITQRNDEPHMTITEKQKRWLKKQVHHLNPVVLVGQHGITESVLAEIEIALNHHELLKIRINAGDREERDAAIGVIQERTQADLVTRIGNVAAFYRANPKKRDPMVLPNL